MDPVTVALAATVLVAVKFLTEQLGQNSSTPRDPVDVYDPEGAHKDVDLDEEITVCYAWDDDRPVSKKKYGVIEVELPSWLDPQEWLRQKSNWKWAWGSGCEKTWPEAWQRLIAYGCQHTAQRLAVVKLLKTKKFRSEFRRSLRERLDAWLATPEGERQYANPFSPRQWECLTKWEHREAKCIDNDLYYSGRYTGWGE